MTYVVCDQAAADCRCILELDHDTDQPHTCQCGGQWTGGDIDSPNFRAVTWPLIGR